MTKIRRIAIATLTGTAILLTSLNVQAQTQATPADADKMKAAAAKLAMAKSTSDFPPLDKVTKGYTEVKSADGKKPYLKLWMSDKKDGQMLAELPRDYASPKHRTYIATTVASGEVFAGLQQRDFYIYWKKYGKRLALIAENVGIRGSDAESKSSVERLFTDRVLLDIPISVSYTHLTLPTILLV